MRKASALIAWMVCMAVAGPVLGAEPPAGGSLKVVVEKIDSGKVRFSLPAPIGQREIPVDDASARQRLGDALPGDILQIDVDQIDNPQHVTRLVTISRPVPWLWRILALAAGFAIVWFAAMVCTAVRPVRFLVGADNRYSNSKVQVAMWFSAVLAAYLATVILRVAVWGWDYLGGVEFTANLVTLSGLSGLTFGAAKAITSQKVDNAVREAVAQEAAAADLAAKAQKVAQFKAAADAARQQATAAQQTAAGKNPANSPSFYNLFQNDKGEADIGDFQMIFFAVPAVVIFLLTVLTSFLAAVAQSKTVTLPDVDTTLLSTFGIGQGAYLVKKIASKPGDG